MEGIQRSEYQATRFYFQRALAFIYYAIGFLIVLNQYIPLVGEAGLTPARLFLERIEFWQSPTLFFLNSSDKAFFIGGAIGLALAVFALSGASDAEWRAYEFKCKPGDVAKRSCLMSPYHYRLDWQMWFAAMSTYQHHPWILNLVAKLLAGDPKTLSLIKHNPFPNAPPKFVRAELYEYRFTTPEERRESSAWWYRKRVQTYLPPLSLDNESFTDILRQVGWLEEL